MRRIFIIAVAAFSAMVCHSCIHKEVKLEDKSILTAVELNIDNEAKEWEINTLRRVAVKFKPGDAIITDFSFEYPDDMFEFIPTREQYAYDVKSLKEGNGSIMAVVNGVRSKALEFSVVDNAPVKVAPEISLYMVTTGADDAKALCPVQFCCDYGERLHLKVESKTKGMSFSFYSADETVIKTIWDKDSEWLVSANMPGLTDIQIIATEADGTEWIYTYEIMVYGHITLSAKCNPVDDIAGFMVEDHPFGELSGDFYITSTLTGCPWGWTHMTHNVTIPPFEKELTFEEGSDYSDIIDVKSAFDEIYDLGYEMSASGEKAWWSPRRIDMYFLVTLSDPYIIIDDVIDDNDREYPDYINFWTYATFEQVGVAYFPESDDNDDTSDNSGGWISHDIYINLN